MPEPLVSAHTNRRLSVTLENGIFSVIVFKDANGINGYSISYIKALKRRFVKLISWKKDRFVYFLQTISLVLNTFC